ncbi:putative holin [Staphylococcus phage vB_SauH_DELF3]|nr:putative holin [Staphylococcus phage vB_SauH_DELF3]
MALDEAIVTLKNLGAIALDIFKETITTKYSNKELVDVSIDIFNTLDNYVKMKYGLKESGIKPDRSIATHHLSNMQIKHLRT